MAASGAVESPDGPLQRSVPDIHREYARLHEGPRVLRTDGVVTLLRMADIQHATKRRDVRSTEPGQEQLGSEILGAPRPLIPLMLDGAEHTKYRKLLDPLFAPREVAKLEDRVRSLCHDLIDGFVEDGTVEIFSAFCEPLPSQIFVTLLGLPLTDMSFFQWFKDGVIRPVDDAHHTEAPRRMIDYIEREHDRRAALADSGDDLFGGFLKAEVDGHRLTRDDVVDIVYLLVMAGLDTVTASLSCFIDWLARNPERRQVLVDEPSRWPDAVEELMRVQTPVISGGRVATEDFDLGDGEVVRAGETLRVMWAAANLDPEVFERPEEVVFDRKANRHIAYASGFHRCLGSHLARLELRVAMECLHERLPDYRPDPDAAPGYNNVHIRNVEPLPLVFTAGPRRRPVHTH